MRKLVLLTALALLPGCYLIHTPDGETPRDADGHGEDAGVPRPDGEAGIRPPGIAAAIAAGFTHACALDRDGSVYCWGNGDLRVLGPDSYLRTPNPIRVALDGRPAVAIGAGHTMNCALMRDGEARCWGLRFHEQAVVFEGAPFVDVDIGLEPCFVSRDGPLVCSGDSPVPGTDDLDPTIRAAEFERVAAGERFFCGLSRGSVLCFGRNTEGQLGRSSASDEDPNPAEVEALSPAIDIATGRQHACALSVEADVYCWGDNTRTQLGVSGPSSSTPVRVEGLPPNVVDIEAGHNNSCVILETGELVCWGDNDFGQLGPERRGMALGPTTIELPARIVAAAIGASFICALDATNNVWCWGRNDYGQLGQGALDSFRSSPGIVRL